jgi:twitching motility protein PilT
MTSSMLLEDYLRFTVDKGASDLHLKAGGAAYVRVDGHLSEITDLPVLTPADTERFVRQALDEKAWDRFSGGDEADAAYSVAGLGRFRVAAFRQRGSAGMVIRLVPGSPPTLDELHLPPAIRKLSEEHRGLVLVTGPTGSGKTTTTAAMLASINTTRRCHIVTIEDPIEVLHRDDLAIVDQREVGIDTRDFAAAMRSVARQDPDVIFVGELRDLETAGTALQASETGHFVMSTLHTTNATETVNRIIDLHPPHHQQQARAALASVLKGVVCQRLLPAKGGGRVAALEILVMTARLQEFIADPAKLELVQDAIAEGEYYGMQTFDQHLLALYRDDRIELDTALSAATSPHDLRLAMRSAGLG